MNYYSIIGVKPTATTEEIEIACDKLSQNADIERQLEAAMARSVLTNDERRIQFDLELYHSLMNEFVQDIRVKQESLPPIPTVNNYYYQNQTEKPDTPLQPEASLLITAGVWFIMAMVTVFVFFFISI